MLQKNLDRNLRNPCGALSARNIWKKEKFVDDDITQVKSIMDDSSNPRNTQKLHGWLEKLTRNEFTRQVVKEFVTDKQKWN
jgi:phosphotransacetylase